MGRSAGIVTLVIGLVASAVLFAMQWSSAGNPTNAKVGRNPNVERANDAALAATQMMADRELQAYQATTGGFAGARIADVSGATVLRADATTYCLQIAANGTVRYESGPGGTLTTQPCG
jgi:hypothetical protein